ncbi:glycosyltransferase family 4 protein [bacterium]|nr:glycosyltransferase family 4 protein [bacterium]
MRIFYVLDHDLSQKVAGTYHVKEISENLYGLGCEVLLFAPGYGVPNEKSLIPIVKVPTTKIRYLRVFLFYVLIVPYLLFYFFKKKPNLFYIREMYISFTVQILAKLLQIPQIIECNGVPSEEVKDLGGSFFSYKLSHKFQEINIRLADKVITVTERLKNLLVTRYHVEAQKIRVIRNGANTELFKPLPKNEAKKILNLEENLVYGCFVSSFYPYHGVSELICAAKIAVQKIPNLRFLMVGDGNDRKKTEQLVVELGISENFIFTGFAEHEKVPFYLSASDFAVCFIRSAKKDDLYSPLKLYEYLACGVPVLASSGIECGGFVESIEAGVSVHLENTQEIALGIEKILVATENFGKNGRDYIAKNGSWKSVAEKVLKECEGLV